MVRSTIALRIGVSVLAVVLVVCSSARASTLATAAVSNGPSSGAFCFIVNVSTKPISVSAQLFDTSGTLISGSATPTVLPPGQGLDLAASGGLGVFYCKFDGPKSGMRASLLNINTSGTTLASVDAR
jgi:hypothetical protein